MLILTVVTLMNSCKNYFELFETVDFVFYSLQVTSCFTLSTVLLKIKDSLCHICCCEIGYIIGPDLGVPKWGWQD